MRSTSRDDGSTRADQIDAAMFKPLYSSAKSKLHELIADEV
jgi:hypothetical protein